MARLSRSYRVSCGATAMSTIANDVPPINESWFTGLTEVSCTIDTVVALRSGHPATSPATTDWIITRRRKCTMNSAAS